jgi:hypothetical protein
LGAFERWPGEGTAQVQWQRVPIAGLGPGKRYGARLTVAGAEVARATLSTLPENATAVRPLSVLLASCFAHRSDRSGRVGRAYQQLPNKPDLKLLCGDQVYLDSPWWAYSRPHTRAALHERIRQHYTNTWSQQTAGGLGGFQRLLMDGSNWFTSDDHELWNNAPNAASFAPDTWTRAGRADWLAAAVPLYDAFQVQRAAASRLQEINVGTLRLLVADTRMDRDRHRRQFMSQGDLEHLEGWLAAPGPPSVLVLGQPVFASRAGFAGHFADWHLQDFQPQWDRLVRALAKAPRSIVVLTGDVHFGRIARATLPTGATLLEVIASPLSLVESPVPTRVKDPAPRSFGDGVRGVPRIVVETIAESLIDFDHFTLLSFAQVGGALRVSVEPWQIREWEPPRRVLPQPWSIDLH